MSIFNNNMFKRIDNPLKSFETASEQDLNTLNNSVQDVPKQAFSSVTDFDSYLRITSVDDVIKVLTNENINLTDGDSIKLFLEGDPKAAELFIRERGNAGEAPFQTFESAEELTNFIRSVASQYLPRNNHDELQKIEGEKGKYHSDQNNFIAKLSESGLASTNKYWTEFFLPSGIPRAFHDFSFTTDIDAVSGVITENQNTYASNGKLSMMCVNATMPARGFMTVDTRHNNIPYKLPYTPTYGDATFIFNSSEDLRERRYFEIWQNAIMNSDGTFNFYNEYNSSVNIHQLDLRGNPTYSVKLIEAYPVNISPVEYSYANTNNLQTISVTLNYKKWIRLD